MRLRAVSVRVRRAVPGALRATLSTACAARPSSTHPFFDP